MARQSKRNRTTKETSISLELNLDGNRNISIATQIPFFDHMLTLLAFHAGFDLSISAVGDLQVDDHHTVEDVGILLGEAVLESLGNKKGIQRYGLCYLPMDEALARAVIDLSNRPFLHYQASFERTSIGGLSLENVIEFMRAFAMESRMSLHIEVLYGSNDHHKVESLFKALGRALREAVFVQGNDVNSTKGVL
jgi:imidazoleglycerol-phosphate dehydratase